MKLLAFPLLAALALPAMAQVNPGTSAANAGVGAQVADRDSVTTAVNAEGQAQYAADMQAYERGARRADRQQARYQHQQRAYADAMAVWREQVRACRHGHNRACRAPTPDPADFY